MPNEKVSQLTPLTSIEISPEDIFLVGDISARESKKMTAEQLLLFVETSGSFNASTSINASSASYILGSNVKGAVTSSSFSNTSISASHALNSDNSRSSSYAVSASYVNRSVLTLVDSASHLVYSPNNGTASYAITSNYTNQSAFLVWSNNNGSASYATRSFQSVSSSFSTTAANVISSSYAKSASVATSSSYSNVSLLSTTASYANSFNNPVKAWAMVTWSFGATVSQPSLYMQNNISSVRYLTNFSSDNWRWITYGVTFESPVNNTNYILFGTAARPYGKPETYDITFHPVYSNRRVDSFTMSFAMNTDVNSMADFFSGLSASYPGSQHAYLSFQILGT